MAKKQTDNEIIQELMAAVEQPSPVVEEVAPVVEEVHSLIAYHKRGRSINQLAGMFMITEAEVKRIINENV